MRAGTRSLSILAHLFDIWAGDTLEHGRRGRVVPGTPRRHRLRFGHGYSRHREGGGHLHGTAHGLTPQGHRDHCLSVGSRHS